ncbi:AMP-binding protein [Natronolimnohabitans innermongolicus]|uniref:AMP-dependent synthetase and ligase n=1 Tax=Natronolimnohabitans innermongolicus JCM 12255 TaxID=1227499 RepID=L9WMK9_9EURY|nr:AMP-binding protein [Natronolimnohabitans innermongolicus]ELY50456.1 AMP-dependent synthetase and ligase [Natronolimnohabitans innermongolicus JCM 12255]
MSHLPPPDERFEVTRESWPDDLPRTLSFPDGRRPIHESVRIRAREHPDAPAVTFYGRTLSWSDLEAAVDAFAKSMRARGYDTGDVCGLYLQNSPQFLVAYHGAHRAGMAVTPINPQFKAPAVARQLEDSDAAVVVTHTDAVDVVRTASAETAVDDVVVTAYGEFAGDGDDVPLPAVVADESPVADVVDDDVPFERLLEEDRSVELPDVALDDAALLQYTGGTTGLPKGCVHTHWNVLFKAATTARVRGYGRPDVLLGTMPLFHVAGKQRYCDALPITGCHAVLLARYEPDAVLASIDEHEVTSTWLAVPSIQELLEHPDVDDYDLTSLSDRREFTNCSSFGTALTRELSDAWRERTGAYVQESGYGLTETHTTDTHTYGDSRVDPGFVGQPCYGVEIEIRDFETNEALPAGESGEIVVRSQATMEEYLNRPDATAAVLEADGFLHTGDVGRLTEDGFLYFLGRRKDTLKVSGHTVSPREVETVLSDHDAVDEVLVVGAPHERRGSVLEAHVVPTDEATTEDALEEAILPFAEANLAEYKVPKRVVRRDSFPRTDVGKVDRVAYRETLPADYE